MTIDLKNNDNRNYYLLGGIILTMVILFTVSKCNRGQTVPQLHIETKDKHREDSLLNAIGLINKSHDSISKQANKLDSIANRYKNKYIALKANIKQMPCDTALKKIIVVCDSMAHNDSLEVATLKYQHKQDSMVNNNYKQIHSIDSTEKVALYENIRKDTIVIRKLNKSLKRQKFITKVAFATGVIAGSVGTYKLTK